MYNWTPREVNDQERRIEDSAAREAYRLGVGDFFMRSVGLNFDRFNTVGNTIEEDKIIRAEEDAGTYHDVRDLLPDDDAVTFDVDSLETNPNAISKEEFETQNYGRRQVTYNADGTVNYGPERIKWNPQMTPQRAQILAETLDARDYDYQILDRSNTNALYSVLGFGAGLFASLPDPINLIPVFGQAKIGATMGARVFAGARGGLIGTMLADSILLPQSYEKGEDVGLGTLAMDLAFGGVIGGGLGGVGGWMHNRRVRKMSGHEDLLRESLIKDGFSESEAASRAHDVINCLSDTKNRSEMSAAVRKAIFGKDREAAGRILDRAVSALMNDGDMDVASWSKLLGIEEPGRVTSDAVKPRLLAEMLEAVEKEGVPQVAFGRLSADRLNALNAIERVGDMDIVRDGKLTLPSNVVWSLFNKDNGLIRNHADANQIADVIMEAMRFDRDVPVPEGGKNRARKLRKVQDKLVESGFIEKGDDGRYRINAETSLGSERKRLISEMEAVGIDREKAESYAKLHVAQALAFQKAYGVDAVKALRSRSIKNIGEAGEGNALFGQGTPGTQFVTEAEARRLDAAEGSQRRSDAIAQAEKMEQRGKSADTIYRKTKARRGSDGKWTLEEKTAETRFAEDEAKWASHIDGLTSKPNGIDSVPMLRQTPAVFHLVGADFSALHVDEHMYDGLGIGAPKKGHHAHPEIDRDTLKALPKALTNPIAIFDYRDASGNIVPKSFIVMVDLPRKNGSTVQVALRLKGFANGKSTINYLETAYEKTHEVTGKPNNRFFMNLVNEADPKKQSLRYINTGLYNTWRDLSFPIMPSATGKVRQHPPLVLAPTVKTEADLVKVKNQYPTFYQTAYNGSPNKFDTFSIEHIGEGEGGAAHGWGLYFALNKDTSVGYAERLSKRGKGHLYRVDIPEDNVMLREEDVFKKQPQVVQDAMKRLLKKIPKEKIEEIKKEAAARIRPIYPSSEMAMLQAQTIPNLKQLANYVRSFAQGEKAHEGKMAFGGMTRWERINKVLEKHYSADEIDILRDPKIAEQEAVRIEGEIAKHEETLFNDEVARETKRVEQKKKVMSSTILNLFKSSTGEDMYSYLSLAFGGPKKASLALNAEGVEGIRYKGTADGECAVVFNDAAINETTRLYQWDGNSAVRGMVDFSNAEPGSAGETYRIFLSPDADASTIPHESAHIFLRELENVVERLEKDGGNIEQARADLRELRKYAGVAEEGKLDADSYRTLQEAVARGFEQYLSEGVAPNPALADVFSRMKNWLKSVYADIKAYVAGTDGVELKPEIREVFDRWLDADRFDSTPDVHDASMPERDFSRPAARQTVEPDTVEATSKAIDDMLNDIDGSPLDYEAARIAQEGDILPEHAALLNEANEELARADILENAALETLECIIGSI